MKNKYFCAHGHFYQPPRENPWTGETEPEESAHPYRDWNSRIFSECYGPNSACPILGEDGRIAAMADNYRLISFNFGPTLLGWLEDQRPAAYRRILEADRESVRERDGHGNGLAQPYYHAILPLQTLAEKRAFVRWGLEDFRRRLGREPEGIWLPETAVDEETLEVLIEQGLRYTILAPSQAARVRELGGGDWRDVSEETLLPTRPYRWVSREQPGRHIALYFYHAGLSRLIVSGEAFATPEALCRKVLARLLPNDSTQLIHTASDGEYFGHHHRGGASALGQALQRIGAAGVALVNYGQFLDAFPPPEEVEIRPKTAWSCDHGLGRWSLDCGCRSPHLPQWRQAWRGPLREALTWLAAEVDAVYQGRAGAYFRDYREALEDYPRRLADPAPEAAATFLSRHGRAPLSTQDARRAVRLLEMQRQRLAMFTSCGWFFDDISGLEAVQCLKHAARAAELARAFGADLGPGLKERLSRAPSNLKRFGDGAKTHERLVLPLAVDLSRAAAHFAILEHLGQGGTRIPRGLTLERLGGWREERREAAGRERRLSWCSLKVGRPLTQEEAGASCAVYQRDRMDLSAWAWPERDTEAQAQELRALFAAAAPEDFERALAERLGPAPFGLDALLPEERRNALRLLMPSPLASRAQRGFMASWGQAVAALRLPAPGVSGAGVPPPTEIARGLPAPGVSGAGVPPPMETGRGLPKSDGEEVLDLLLKARGQGIPPDRLPWVEEAHSRLRANLEALLEEASPQTLSRAARWLEAFEEAGLAVSLWDLQEFFWRWRDKILARGAAPGEREAALALGEKLNVSDSALPVPAPGVPGA